MSSPAPTASVLAEAAARRRASTEAASAASPLDQGHEQRQMFRRLVDPGIFRPNSKAVAMDSLKALSTIADNILRDPGNPKYHTFKRENDTIKRRLIEPRGALEYALALGFRPKVVDFQSHYVFHPSRMADLRVGAAILKEALDRETDKEERAQRSREEKKAADAAVAQNVKLAFLDDRRRKMLCDQRERELRAAQDSARGPPQSAPASSPSLGHGPGPMPGTGHALTSIDSDREDTGTDQPPPYSD